MSSGRLTALSRRAFPVLAWIFVGCLVIQLFLVGLDVFKVVGPDSTIHRTFAYAYGWLSAALVLAAVVGRLEATRVRWTVILLVLFALQTYLPSLAQRAPVLAAFHSVNALALFWLALHLARHAADRVEHAPSYGGS